MEAVDLIAQMMEIAAITAPKTKGENFVLIKTLKKDQLEQLAQGMIAFGERKQKNNFDRDADNVLKSEAIVLIGYKDAQPAKLDCGACGYPTCNDLKSAKVENGEFRGPTCAYRLLDMGIALGSAVKTASLFNVDNRIMYRIGAVARDIGLVDWDFVIGIPLSISGKNIYFDRP